MRRVFLDFESFYSRDYSLRSMTAYEYIKDPRFSLLLLAWCEETERGTGFVRSVVGEDEIAKTLTDLKLDDAEVVAHNGLGFDHLILGWRFGVRARRWSDTMLMWQRIEQGPYSLAEIARRLNLPAKGTTVADMKGRALADMTPTEVKAYREYCEHDVALCARIYHEAAPRVRTDDLDWIDLCSRMATDPRVRLSHSALQEGLREEQQRQHDTKLDLARMMAMMDCTIPKRLWAGKRKKDPPIRLEEAVTRLVRSDAALAELLEAMDYEVPMKISPTTNKPVPAFGSKDDPFRFWIEEDDPFLAAVADCRLTAKSTINLSRAARLLDIERIFDGACPIFLKPMGTISGRDAGAQKVNFQNLSKRPSRNNPHGKNSPVRRALIAPPGYRVVAADSAQVEVRVTGVLARERNILDPFSDETRDPYCEFASRYLYNRPIVKGVDTFERNVAKSAVLGNGFGQGGPSFRTHCASMGIKLSLEEAKRIVRVYREAHPFVVALWQACGMALNRMIAGGTLAFGPDEKLLAERGSLRLPSGRRLLYHGLQRDQKGLTYWDGIKRARRRIYGSLLMQNVIQATAADIIHGHAINLWRAHNLRPVLCVHDELVYVVPEKDAEHVRDLLVQEMSTAPRWLEGIPLSAEGGIGKSYADV